MHKTETSTYTNMVKFTGKPQQKHPESIFSGFTSVISETIEMRRSGATPNRSFFGRR